MGYFKLKERDANLKTEITAGITTFMAMSYILFVNPAILSQAGQTGVSFESIFIATCVGAGIMSIAMGLISNTPFALAAGMGINTVVVFTIMYGLGLNFAQAMGIIVIEGVMFAILAITRIRRMIVGAIPGDLKYAIGAGIGLFIAFMGLRQGGFINIGPAAGLMLGDFTANHTLLALFGLALTIILLVFKIKGAILLGILGTIAAGLVFNIVPLPREIVSIPTRQSFQTFFVADPVRAVWSNGAVNLAALIMVFALFMADFFDTLGAAIGVGAKAGLEDKKGQVLGLKKVLIVDALGSIVGGFLGAGSVSTGMESASGVSAGGKTGIVPAVAGFLFLLSVFFAPLIAVVGGGIEVGGVYKYPITAPAFIMVGFFMVRMIARINFKDFDIGIPAFFTIAIMPFTYNITYGIGFGLISYTIIKLLRGKYRELHPIMIITSIVFAITFIAESIAKRIGAG